MKTINYFPVARSGTVPDSALTFPVLIFLAGFFYYISFALLVLLEKVKKTTSLDS